MLTEADMIRILAEKYSLADSLAEEHVDNESHEVLGDGNASRKLSYDLPDMRDFTD